MTKSDKTATASDVPKAAAIPADTNLPATGDASAVAAALTVEAESTTAEAGMRVRKSFMLRQFIPSPDWINVNVVAKGKGTRVTIGRVFGVAESAEEKENVLPDGSTSKSTVLKGVFNSESYLDGEIGQSTSAYLPEAYAGKIRTMFAADKNLKLVELDCDIGLESTGKTIPYEWVVVAYREGAEMAVLKRIANSRGRPASAPPLPDPALTGPETVPALTGATSK